MKKIILFSALFGFMMCVLTGCVSSTEKAGTTSQVSTGADNSSSDSKNENPNSETNDSKPSADTPKTPEDNTVISLNDIKDWITLYTDSKEPEKAAVYDEVFALIQKSTKISGTILKSSKHFGPWYLLSIQTPSTEDLDEPFHYNAAFLVDMSKKAVIAKGDHKSAAVLLNRLIELSLENDESGMGSDTNTLASVVSSIEFNHSGYTEDVEIKGAHDPKLTKDDSGAVRLEYFIEPDGTPDSMKRCVLTVNGDDIIFEMQTI